MCRGLLKSVAVVKRPYVFYYSVDFLLLLSFIHLFIIIIIIIIIIVLLILPFVIIKPIPQVLKVYLRVIDEVYLAKIASLASKKWTNKK